MKKKHNIRRKVTMSLTEEQFKDLDELMKEDKQDNFTFYGVFLIQQEKKRRENERSKVGRGRPKKEGEEDKEVLYYPAPYDPEAPPYTMDDLEAYYSFSNQKVPEQPRPFTKEDLS